MGSKIKNPVFVISWCVVIAVLIVFFNFFIKYAVNIPSIDDFTIAGQALDMLEGKDFWHTLTKNHNEHRVLTARLGFWLMALLGQIRFDYAMWFGLPLWGLLFFLLAANSKIESHLKYACAAFLAFNLCYHTNIFMGMTSIQNLGIVVFAGLAGYAYQMAIFSNQSNRNIYLLLSCVFGLISAISGGNGMFVFIALTMVSLLGKNYKSAVLYATVFVLFASWYFYNYQVPANNPDAGILAFFKNPLPRIIFFFSFLASPLSVVFPTAITVWVFGLALALGIIFSPFKKNWFLQRPFYTSLLWFCVLTGLAAAINRAGSSGALVDSPFSTRFAHYGLVIIFILILYYLEDFNSKLQRLWLFAITFICSAVFCGSFIVHARDVKYLHEMKILSMVNYYRTGLGLDHNYIFTDEAIYDFERMKTKGLYSPPQKSIDLVNQLNSNPQTKEFLGSVNVEYKENQSVWIGAAVNNNQTLEGVGEWFFVCLVQKGKSTPYYVLPTYPIPRGGFKGFRNLQTLLDDKDNGALAIIKARNIKLNPGIYDVALWQNKPNGEVPILWKTQKTCLIKPFIPDANLVPNQTP